MEILMSKRTVFLDCVSHHFLGLFLLTREKRGNFSLIQVNKVEPLPTPAPHIPKRSVIPNSETTLYIPFQTQSLCQGSHGLPLTHPPRHHPHLPNVPEPPPSQGFM